MNDPIKQLRSVDPARRMSLDSIDPSGWNALRDGTSMTSRTAADPTDELSTPVRRRRWRRGHTVAAIAVVAVAATAGGAATYIAGYFGGYPLNCMTVWGQQDPLIGGELISGDPVADCAVYWADAGIEPPADGVAFTYGGHTYVTPADQVPDGVTLLNGEPVLTPDEMELRMSIFDSVDGGEMCRTIDEAAAWTQSEIDRLGLTDTWTVSITGRATDPEWDDGVDRPCAMIATSEYAKTVSVYPGEDPDVFIFPDGNPRADYLREQITDQCLTVDEAQAVVDQMLADRGETEGTTINKVVDESASCARVDLEIGGGLSIAVYGPTTVTEQ